MPIVAKKEKKDYENAPEGLWPGVCCDVIDLGMLPGFEGKIQHKIKIVWQIEERDSKGKRFRVSNRYTLSLHERASLSKLLEAWRGRKFTSQERDGFDLEKLIGANCQVQTVHNIKDDDIFVNVQAVVPYPKGVVALRVEDYVREIDRNGNDGGGSQVIDDSDVPF
jgi:hypothetical protein